VVRVNGVLRDPERKEIARAALERADISSVVSGGNPLTDQRHGTDVDPASGEAFFDDRRKEIDPAATSHHLRTLFTRETARDRRRPGQTFTRENGGDSDPARNR
jgi:hypothetical protein